MTRAAAAFEPRQVLLFSGHRVDAPGRASPRFPAAHVAAAGVAIARTLDALRAGPADLALTQAAAGGDLLFTHACLARGVRVQWLLPLPEPAFIAQSVLGCAAPPDWRACYRALRARLPEAPRVLEDELGALPDGADAFERCNRWLLDTALAHGAARLRVICLWDGGAGEGRGGTAHLVHAARRHTAHVSWIDTRRLGAGVP